jgi:hypothetical protein
MRHEKPTPDDDNPENNLSEEFELCAYGLNEARKEWERRDSGGEGRLFVFN